MRDGDPGPLRHDRIGPGGPGFRWREVPAELSWLDFNGRVSTRSSCYTNPVRNVTITMDDETALWARMEAASRDTSVSRFVGEILRQQMLDNAEYARARRSYGGRPPSPLGADNQSYPRREEIHAR